MRYITFSFLMLFVFFTPNSWSQSPDLKTIMKGESFVGAWPKNVSYGAFGDTIFYYRQHELDTMKNWFALVEGDEIQVKDNYAFRFGNKIHHPTNRSKFLWIQENSICLGSYKSNSLTPLVILTTSIQQVRWMGTTDVFTFTTDDKIYKYENGSFKVIIEFEEKKNEKKNEADQWLSEQQQLFDVLTLRAKRSQANERIAATKKKYEVIATEFTGKLSNIQISNDNNTVWATISKRKDQSTVYMDYVTQDGYSKSKSARSKVGLSEVNQDLYSYNKSNEEFSKIDFSNLKGMYSKPEYLRESEDDTLNQPKSVHVHGPILNAYNNWGIVSLKSEDNKDRWVLLVHPEKEPILVDHQHDEAWIGGPGITGWNMVEGTIGWFDNGNQIYFQSEVTGYSHLYAYNLTERSKVALTSGKFEIHDVQLSRFKDVFYITANKIDPGVRNFYHLNWKSKKLTPILEGKMNVEVSIAPDEKTISGRVSDWLSPWELFTATNQKGATLKKQTKSISTAFAKVNYEAPKRIYFEATDGAQVPARLYQPKKSNGAAVIFVHGAGYLQNAHFWWSTYFREFMFNQLLREKGYTVLDIDYRASKGYGRDWRTAIYRHMGGKDLSDQIDGRQYLIDSLHVNPERVGIYGGSYGGFITLMALLTEPGKFACGAALRSVADWAHYNHPYTSNILNTPVQDSLAYARSSPINFAENLEDQLLMLHGVLDGNVQYQDILRLSQRFIELGKENWELASFPLEAHGFKHPTSWYDEYRRILELFEEQLR